MQNATQETRNTDEHIWIELNKQGVVAIHGEIADTPFLSLIGPAITHLDRTIQDLQAFTSSKQFAEIVKDAAQRMEIAAGSSEVAAELWHHTNLKNGMSS